MEESITKRIKKACNEWNETLYYIAIKSILTSNETEQFLSGNGLDFYMVEALKELFNIISRNDDRSITFPSWDKFIYSKNGEGIVDSRVDLSFIKDIKLSILVVSPSNIKNGKFIFDVFCDRISRIKNVNEDVAKLINTMKNSDLTILSTNKYSKTDKPVYDFESDECIYIEDYIEIIFGDNEKSSIVKKSIKKIYDNYLLYKNSSMNELKGYNEDIFNECIIDIYFENSKKNLNLTNQEYDGIKKYILNMPDSSKIIKLFCSFIKTKQMFEDESNSFDYYDLTFVAVSTFKIVEIVFCRLLNKKWPKRKIRDSYNKKILLDDDELTLGEMNQIFFVDVAKEKCDNKLVNDYLESKKETPILKNLLSHWISSSRNNFMHKDIIDAENVESLEKAIEDSFTILSLIIKVFA